VRRQGLATISQFVLRFGSALMDHFLLPICSMRESHVASWSMEEPEAELKPCLETCVGPLRVAGPRGENQT
jgi:hypothetical protein